MWVLALFFCLSSVYSQNLDSLFHVVDTAQDLSDQAKAYRALSRAYRNINLDSADLFIKKSSTAAKASGDQTLYYLIQNSVGALHWMKGDLPAAEKTFATALRYWEKKQDTLEISRSLLNLGTVCQSQFKNEAAIQHFRKANAIAHKQGNILIEAQSNGGIGIIYFQMKEVDSMNYYQRKALDGFILLNDSTNIGRNFTNLGLYNRELGQSYAARENYLTALEYLKNSTETGLIGKCNEGLGNLEYRTGHYDRAVTYFLNAREAYESLGWDLRIAHINVEIGLCFDTWNRRKTAREYYRMAYNSSKELGELRVQSSALSNLASLELKENKPKLAISLFRESTRIDEQSAGYEVTYSNLVGIGQAFHKLKEMDSAEIYMNRGLKKAIQAKHERGAGQTYFHLAELYLDQEQYGKCLSFLDSSEVWFSTTHQSDGIHDVNELKSKCYEQMGDFVNALHASREADRWRDSLFTQSSTEQLLELEARYWTERKEHSLELAQTNEALRTAEAEAAKEASSKLAAQRNMLILALIFLVIVGALVFYLLTQRRKNRYRLQVSEMKLQTLRAQMNPHFIFNALGSVQLLINTQNVKEANLYLSKFARLLRGIMETSTRTDVTVEEEKEGLALYIELEALRFKFQYNLLVDPTLEADTVRIPSMVLQPFVENAIKHGLQHKKDKGKLTIQFQDHGSEVQCLIIDNGIGREAAGTRPRHSLENLSISTKLIRERLRLMPPARPDRLTITDLKTETGEAAGTQVEILLPKV